MQRKSNRWSCLHRQPERCALGTLVLLLCAGAATARAQQPCDASPLVITPPVDTIPINASAQYTVCGTASGNATFFSDNPLIASVTAAGSVQALQVGAARIIAQSDVFADTALLVVTEPARLTIRTRSVAPAGDTIRHAPGLIVPALALVMTASGHEDIQILRLPFIILGVDPAAEILLVLDTDRDGQVDDGDAIVARAPATLEGRRLDLELVPDSLVVAERDSVQVLLAIRFSGSARNYGFFQATFIGAEAGTRGVRSNALDQFGDIGPTASQVFFTTNLQDRQLLALSENPVRSDRVIFNFAAIPRMAVIYTLTGRRVLDLLPHLDWDGSFIWNLRNTDGDRVAAGVYLVVFEMRGRVVREKLFIMGTQR